MKTITLKMNYDLYSSLVQILTTYYNDEVDYMRRNSGDMDTTDLAETQLKLDYIEEILGEITAGKGENDKAN